MIDELLGAAFLAWPLTLIVLIVIASVVSISAFVFFAARSGRGKWRWALVGFLVVFLPIFWDWVPTVMAHKHYCEKEAGFWVYKTLDQWKAENPGVAETLVANTKVVTARNAFVLNQRFNWVIKEERYFPLNYMMREEQQVMDSKTGEVLARYVNFSALHQRRQADWAGWKFWLNRQHCRGGVRNDSKLYHFFGAAKHIGEGVTK
jgi:hypothetical protein